MVKAFYYRFAVLFLAMVCVVLCVGILALLPAYFFSNSKNSIVDKKIEIQKTEAVPLLDQETSIVIKDVNNKLNLVENAEKGEFLVSEKVINAILLEKIPSIKITRISYENNSPEGKKINIFGTAPSREVLLLFRRALEQNTSFKSVDLPISNFVKGSNIEFSLTLVPA